MHYLQLETNCIMGGFWEMSGAGRHIIDLNFPLKQLPRSFPLNLSERIIKLTFQAVELLQNIEH